MRLLLCRTCLQYSFSLLRFIMKEWFCRYGTGPPMVKWYYSICKQLQFIVGIRKWNRKESCSKLTLFLKGGLSLIFRKHFLFAASVNCPVIDNQRKSAKVAQAWLGWGGCSEEKTHIMIFQQPKYFLLECSDSLVWLKLYKCTGKKSHQINQLSKK